MDGSDLIVETSAIASDVQSEGTENSAPEKKKFVAPEVSVPVDVLEATTFFQLTTSGSSN